MRRGSSFLLVCMTVWALLGAAPARAQVETYGFDTAHTQILFFVSHLGFSYSMGKFYDFEGSVTLDRANPANSSVHVRIFADSLDMGTEKWNEHMRNADFFDTENFPEILFESTSVRLMDVQEGQEGGERAELTGNLTILGVTQPVTLAVTHNKSAEHPFSKAFVAGFSAHGTVNRSDFGMTYGLPGIGDTVEIRLEAELVRENAKEEQDRDETE